MSVLAARPSDPQSCFQGHIHMAPAQIEVAEHWELPTDAKMIRSFLGQTNFFRGHIHDYANIAAPLKPFYDLAWRTTSIPEGYRIPLGQVPQPPSQWA